MTAPGLLTEQPAPDVARRSWPRYAALGAGMIAVAVVGAFWAGGARLLLGAIGVFLVVRGVALLREGGSGATGPLAVAAGALGLVAALVSPTLAGTVLLGAVPVVLLVAAAVLTAGSRTRRSGLGLLAVALLVTGLLVATGLGQDWARAADVARVVTALVVAALGIPVLLAAVSLRALAAQPPPAPARPTGCGGCACGAGGCGS